MLYILLLLASVIFDLILLTTGVTLLLKVKNKLAGMLVIVVGLVFTLSPIAFYLFVMITQRIQS